MGTYNEFHVFIVLLSSLIINNMYKLENREPNSENLNGWFFCNRHTFSSKKKITSELYNQLNN